MKVKDLFEMHAEQIDRIIMLTSKKKNIKGDLQHDFKSYVYEKLFENNGKRLQAFKGDHDASWSGYLSIVILRLAIDFIKKQWGRWENSTSARVLGEVAMEFEALLYRDRLPFSEACTILLEHPGYRCLYRLSEKEMDLFERVLPEMIIRKLKAYQKPAFYTRDSFFKLAAQSLTEKEQAVVLNELDIIQIPLSHDLLAEWELLLQKNHAARKSAVYLPLQDLKQPNPDLDLLANLEDCHGKNPLDNLITREIKEKLEPFLDHLLSDLTPEDKTIISFYLLSDLNISEIARLMNPQMAGVTSKQQKMSVSTKNWKQINKRIQKFMSQIQKKIVSMGVDREDWGTVSRHCLLTISNKL